MSAQRQLEYSFTEAQYWEMEEFSEVKHEFWNGQIYAMAGATPKHNDIAGNVFASLHGQLRGKSCIPRTSDQRLKAGTIQTYPDVVVACRPLQYDPNNPITLVNATVIAEVLSDSTQRNDRNAKFDAYKELPSLRHYLLISQMPYEVEHHFLDENGIWRSENFNSSDDVIRLQVIECKLSLNEIYDVFE